MLADTICHFHETKQPKTLVGLQTDLLQNRDADISERRHRDHRYDEVFPQCSTQMPAVSTLKTVRPYAVRIVLPQTLLLFAPLLNADRRRKKKLGWAGNDPAYARNAMRLSQQTDWLDGKEKNGPCI